MSANADLPGDGQRFPAADATGQSPVDPPAPAAETIVVQPSEAVRVAQFHRELIERTPRVWVTWSLLAANIGVWLAMVANGVHFFSPSPDDLVRWGADFGPLTINGQWWRLISAAFVHIGILHLALNMWCLFGLGSLMERLVGHAGCLLLYVACAAAGNVASLAWNPNLVSAGASGAVFGLAGGLLGFMLRAHGAIPMQALKQIRGSMTTFIVFNLFLGLRIKGIDNAAHIGGLAMGLVGGLLLAAPLTEQGAARRWLRNLGVCLLGVVPVVVGIQKLPRMADLGAEIQAFSKVESQALAAFNDNLAKAQAGELSDADFAAVVRRACLDPWSAATHRLEELKNVSTAQRPLYDALIHYARQREDAFREIADATEASDAQRATAGFAKLSEADKLAQQLTAKFGQQE
jgi:rhomboid protease GluP